MARTCVVLQCNTTAHARLSPETHWMDCMSLTPENVATIARLSRLALIPEQADLAGRHLNRFFDTVVASMQQVDTTGLQPLAHPTDVMHEMALRLRDDVASEPDRRDLNQQSAPAIEDGLFLVPKVIE